MRLPRESAQVAIAAALAAHMGTALAQTLPPAGSDVSAQDPGRLATTYRRQTIEAAAKLKDFPPLAGAEISALRASRAPQPGQWMACLRTAPQAGAAPGTFAVFFDDEAPEIRRAVLVDRCGGETYSALALPVAETRKTAAAKRPPKAASPR